MRALVLGLAGVALAAPAASAATANPKGAGCDRLDDAACMLPFPNDAFSNPSASSSGRRLFFRPRNMPRNRAGTPISTAAYRTLDGFSPSSTILTKVRGLDTPAALRRTNPAQLSDVSRYSARNAPVIVFDARNGKRFPIWVELDMTAARPADRLLLIHPAKSLQEGHRYVVVLRNLKNARGRAIAAGARFAALRDDRRRETRYQSIFRALRRAGIKRDRSLFLTWDFTVASQRSLTGRMQTIRDRAFEQLGDRDLADGRIDGAVPAHATTVGTPPAGAPAGTRVVQGTVTVPCFLDTTGCAPGGSFHYARTGDFLPAQRAGNVAQARFTCLVPASATASAPARLVLYGHDLLGSDGDVATAPGLAELANEHDMVLCATPLSGAASADAATVAQAVADASRMPRVADALQQGILNALYLGRLMAHPQGLAADPLLQAGGQSIVAAGQTFYAGDGLGATAGAALTAFAPDLARAALGDPALHLALPEPAGYPPRERPLVRELARILTDRATAGGLAGHLGVSPPPLSPPHVALLQPTFSDRAGMPVEALALARTIGARVHLPALASGRTPLRRPFWGLQPLPGGWTASGLSLWDAGAAADPAAQRRRTPAARQQISDFLAPAGRV
ncbi:MAG: hypothetical protein QOF17_1102, partial [Solirubrobacteraceae bacterium]|nr:hypothetical protein [Solirubrobacteraceae bacterium]